MIYSDFSTIHGDFPMILPSFSHDIPSTVDHTSAPASPRHAALRRWRRRQLPLVPRNGDDFEWRAITIWLFNIAMKNHHFE